MRTSAVRALVAAPTSAQPTCGVSSVDDDDDDAATDDAFDLRVVDFVDGGVIVVVAAKSVVGFKIALAPSPV